MLKLPSLTSSQLDGINMGLMVISLILAYILPFELFLFSYAVLGPLHYLTEISWLHQKNYFIPGKINVWNFAIVASIIGILVFISNYGSEFYEYFSGKTIEFELENWGTNLILYVFFLSMILVVLQKKSHRIAGIIILSLIVLFFNFEQHCLQLINHEQKNLGEVCVSEYPKYIAITEANVTDQNGNKIENATLLMKHKKGYELISAGENGQVNIPKNASIINVKGETIEFGDNKGFRFENNISGSVIFFSVFLPTLIHVFLFTALFMLFGALKSNSTTGLISFFFLFICAALPFIYDPSFISYHGVSEYIRKSYNDSFYSLNYQLFELFKLGPLQGREIAEASIYSSKSGIAVTRFIAFAYTYHYLNWFSKTSIIQWHKTPVLNLTVVLVLWVTSVLLYAFDYKTGLIALFFLSFLHVFMEFPLNFQSIIGIVKNVGHRTGIIKTV